MDLTHIFWVYAQQQGGLLLMMFLVAVTVPVLELIMLPRLYLQLIESVNSTPNRINRGLVEIVSVVVILQLVHVSRCFLINRMIPTFECFLQTHIMRRILHREATCGVLTSGDIVYLLSTVSEISRTWVEWWNDHILPHGALLLCAFFVFWRMDGVLALYFTTFFVCLSLLVWQTLEQSHASAQHHVQSMSHLHTQLEDLIRNAPAVRSANMVDVEVDRLRDDVIPVAFKDYHKAFAGAQQLQSIMVPLALVFFVVFLKRVIQLRREGRISQTEFVSTFFMIANLLSCFTWFSDTVGEAIMDAQHMVHLVSSTSEVAKDRASWSFVFPSHRPPDGAIGMENVWFTYHGHTIFHGRSLNFRHRVRTAVVGGVGTGKSTLLRLFLGFCVPDKGHLYVQGSWYGELTPSSVRSCIGMVPQDAVLFDASLIYNVRYGSESTCTEEEVARFVEEKAGHVLGDRMQATSVGPGGQHLSGGQRQLVWCLRIMLRAPPVILMDEPTAFMDDACKAVLIRLLYDVERNGGTVLLVTHDTFLLSQCHNVVDLSTSN